MRRRVVRCVCFPPLFYYRKSVLFTRCFRHRSVSRAREGRPVGCAGLAPNHRSHGVFPAKKNLPNFGLHSHLFQAQQSEWASVPSVESIVRDMWTKVPPPPTTKLQTPIVFSVTCTHQGWKSVFPATRLRGREQRRGGGRHEEP